MHLVQHTKLEDEHEAYKREGVETNQEKGSPEAVEPNVSAQSQSHGWKFKVVPSVFMPQESTGDTGEDEKCTKYTEPRVELGVQSNRSG